MNPLFANLALDWLDAERKANPAEWPLERLTQIKDEMTVAVDRVYQVISGNVRWDDASPGDKAIWKSRVTDMSMFSRSWNRDGTCEALEAPEAPFEPVSDPIRRERQQYSGSSGNGPRLHGIRERLWWVFYDTIRLDATDHLDRSVYPPSLRAGSYHMFGNANIGNMFLTNLQIPGQMPGDSSFLVTNVFATVGSLEALHWAADNVMFELVIGEKRVLPTLYLRELFRGITLDTKGRRPLMIPVRQNYRVLATMRGEYPKTLPPCDLVFNIEGLLTRDIQ